MRAIRWINPPQEKIGRARKISDYLYAAFLVAIITSIPSMIFCMFAFEESDPLKDLRFFLIWAIVAVGAIILIIRHSKKHL